MEDLHQKQIEAIKALSSGLSATAAADAIGVHRTTIHHWCRHIPAFRDTLEATKRAYIDTYRDGMNTLAPTAIRILKDTLEDPATSPALRVRTALAIIKFVTTPEKPQSPKQQANDELLDAAYVAGYNAALHQEPAPESEIHHNSSLSTPVETDEPQTPRNALCPCGSKLKFKRCCGKDAPPVLSHPNQKAA
ncbi:MAG: SEC-C domain-containing protein [Acidobacteria bacterium]|nr:SEC-C domain-containing protein [Acidobacteriota bacterium]